MIAENIEIYNGVLIYKSLKEHLEYVVCCFAFLPASVKILDADVIGE